MMDFGAHTAARRGARDSNIVPMINVVFLLLIFFLMTAQITPPAPLEVSPPSAEVTPSENLREGILFIASDGGLAYEAARDEAVFDLIPANEPLRIRADQSLDAQGLAALLPRLAAIGVSDVTLVTEVSP